MKRTGLLAALTVALFAVFATPASAHTSNISHHETCSDSGTTTTVVTFDNDYGLAADVAYRWGSETPGSAHMAAKTGSANTTVSLPSHPVGTIAWHVTWSDNYRQPTSGESSLTIAPLADCHATTTTTAAATTTTTKPATTTTTLPIAVLPTTTSTAEPTTTSTAAATTTTTAEASAVPTTTTTAPTAVLGTTQSLPRTGFPIAFMTAVGLFCLLLGGLALYANRVERPE
jgi:hypothetical protein